MIFLGGSKMKKILFVLMFCTLSAFSYARTYYGAIALNTRTGATGYSYDYYTKNSAISAARGHCRGNCIVPVVFWNTCAAVSWSPSTQRYGWAYSGNTYSNKTWANRKCGSRDCRVVANVCTSR